MIVRCEKCDKQILQKSLQSCPVCGGALTEVVKVFNRQEFGKRRQICKQCKYYGVFRGRLGCLMLDKPCRVERLWMKPNDDWCPMGLAQKEEKSNETKRD